MLGLVCAEGVRASELTSDFAPLGQRTGVLYHTSLELQKQGRQYHAYVPLRPKRSIFRLRVRSIILDKSPRMGAQRRAAADNSKHFELTNFVVQF